MGGCHLTVIYQPESGVTQTISSTTNVCTDTSLGLTPIDQYQGL